MGEPPDHETRLDRRRPLHPLGPGKTWPGRYPLKSRCHRGRCPSSRIKGPDPTCVVRMPDGAGNCLEIKNRFRSRSS